MTPTATNNLYPVFLKLDQLQVLVVGGGYVGEEKLNSLLKSSPNASIKLVGREISPAIKEFQNSFEKLCCRVINPIQLISITTSQPQTCIQSG